MALVSVIIPARNAVRTIGRALRSLASDATVISEILLVDDGSEDNTAASAQATATRFRLPLKIIRIQAGSAGTARNAGMAVAQSEYVYFLDSDDELMSGGLELLVEALHATVHAGMAVGANIRRTDGRADKLKKPFGFSAEPMANARACMRNKIWPIAMGSALVRRQAIGAARFPQRPSLDEDTIFWAAVMTRTGVVTVSSAVLVYHHDEARMTERFVRNPNASFEAVSDALETLSGFGIPSQDIEWRKAWVALRIARQLIIAGKHREAARFVERAQQDKALSRSWKVLQYRFRILAGKMGLLNVQAPARPAAVLRPPNQRSFLLVTHDPVWPPVSGSELRNWRIACALARFGSVTIASVRSSLMPVDHGIAAIKCVSLAPNGSGERAISSLRARVEPRLTVGTSEKLRALANDQRPDVTVFSGAMLSTLLNTAKPFTRHLVLDMQNVESDLLLQSAKSQPVMTRLRTAWDARRLRSLEKRVMDTADQVFVCSRQDRDRLIIMTGTKRLVTIIPNIMPKPDEAEEPVRKFAYKTGGFPVILFAGHLGYWPNVDAVSRLATRVFPLIRQHYHGAKLVLAGRSPKSAVLALARLDGIELVENPQDMTQLYRQADIAILPIGSGGGTRIKILEAMQFAVPVVATRLAAEGLDLAEGKDYLCGESDEELANAAISLLQDETRYDALRRRARMTARARFGDETFNESVRDSLDRASAFGIDITIRQTAH